MTEPARPKDYEGVIRLIHDRYDGMSKTYQKISVYLTQNPNEVAVKSVNSIAEKVDIHASSLVRFAQALGYKGFKELQTLFQRRLATAAPGFEARFQAMKEQLANRDDMTETGFLHELILQDLASLQALLEDTNQEDLAAAADLISQAKVIYILGQLRAEPVALLLRYMLTMLGKRAVFLGSSGGLATHMARTIRPQDVLVAVSFRFYANEVVSIVEEAGRKEIPIVAITDSTLSPMARSARVLFAVPERENSFTRSLSAPICLAQALVVAVAARVQNDKKAPRIPIATEA